jgi:bacteriorhodopsin
MTVAMMISLALAGISFWVSAAGITLNLIGRLFYTRLKPKRGILFWLTSFIMFVSIFAYFAYASKMHLGDGVWW